MSYQRPAYDISEDLKALLSQLYQQYSYEIAKSRNSALLRAQFGLFAVSGLASNVSELPMVVAPTGELPLGRLYQTANELEQAKIIGAIWNQWVLPTTRKIQVPSNTTYNTNDFVRWWTGIFATGFEQLIPKIPPAMLRAFYTLMDSEAASHWFLDRFDAGFKDYRYLTGTQLTELGDGFDKFVAALVSGNRNLMMLDIIRNPPQWVHDLSASQISSLLAYHAQIRAVQYADVNNEPYSVSNWRLSADFINALSPASVKGISKNSFLNVDLSKLSPSALANVSRAQIEVALPGSLQRLSATQIASIDPATWGSNFGIFCQSLTNTQLQALTDGQVASIWKGPGYYSYQISTWNRFSPQQQELIVTQHWQAIPPAVVNFMATNDVGRSQLSLLDPDSMASLPASVLASYSNDVWAAVSIWSIRSLGVEAITALSPFVRLQVWSRLSSDSWWALDGNEIRAWTNGDPNRETNGQLMIITGQDQLDAATGAKLPKFNAPTGLPTSIKASDLSNMVLGAEFQKASNLYVPAGARIILNLTAEQVSYLESKGIWQAARNASPMLRDLLPPALLRTPFQLSQMTASEAALLDPETISRFSTQQIAALSSAVVSSLTDAQLLAFDPMRMVGLDAVQLRLFAAASKGQKLPQIDRSVLSDYLSTPLAANSTIAGLAEGFRSPLKPAQIYANRPAMSQGSVYQRGGQAWRESYTYEYVSSARGYFEGDRVKDMAGYLKSLPNSGRMARLVLNSIGSPLIFLNFIFRAKEASDPLTKAYETMRAIETLASALRVPVDLLSLWYFETSASMRDRLYPDLSEARKWLNSSSVPGNAKLLVPSNEGWFVRLRQRIGNTAEVPGGITSKTLSHMSGRRFVPLTGGARTAAMVGMSPGFLQDLMLLPMAVLGIVLAARKSSGTEIVADVMTAISTGISAATFIDSDIFLATYGKTPTLDPELPENLQANGRLRTDIGSSNANAYAGRAVVLGVAVAVVADIIRASGKLAGATTDSQLMGAGAYWAFSVGRGAASLALTAIMLTSLGPLGIVAMGMSLLLPNAQAIGTAVELKALIDEYNNTGRATIARYVLKPMYDLAIADSIGIVNWFSFMYHEGAKAAVWNSITSDVINQMVYEAQQYKEKHHAGFISMLTNSVSSILATEQAGGAHIQSERLYLGSLQDVAEFVLDGKAGVTTSLVKEDGSIANVYPFVGSYWVSSQKDPSGNLRTSNGVQSTGSPWIQSDNFNSESDDTGYAKVTLSATDEFTRLGIAYTVDATGSGKYTSTSYVFQTALVNLKVGAVDRNTYVINYSSMSTTDAAGMVTGTLPTIVVSNPEDLESKNHHYVILAGLPAFSKMKGPIDISSIANGTTVFGDETGSWIRSSLPNVTFVAGKGATDYVGLYGGGATVLLNGHGSSFDGSKGANTVEVALDWRNGAADTQSFYNGNFGGGNYSGDYKENIITFRHSTTAVEINLKEASTALNGCVFNASIMSSDTKSIVYSTSGSSNEGADDAFFRGFDRVVGASEAPTNWNVYWLNKDASTYDAAQFKGVTMIDFMPSPNVAEIIDSKFLTVNAHGALTMVPGSKATPVGANSVDISASHDIIYNAIGATNAVRLNSSTDIVLNLGNKVPDELFNSSELILASHDQITATGNTSFTVNVGQGEHSISTYQTDSSFRASVKINVEKIGSGTPDSSAGASVVSNNLTKIFSDSTTTSEVYLNRGRGVEDQLAVGMAKDGLHIWLRQDNVEIIVQGATYYANSGTGYSSYREFLSDSESTKGGTGFGSIKFFENDPLLPSSSAVNYFTVGQLVNAIDDAWKNNATAFVGEQNGVVYYDYKALANYFNSKDTYDNVPLNKVGGSAFIVRP